MQRISIKWLASLALLAVLILLIVSHILDTRKSAQKALYGGLIPSQSDTLSQVVRGKPLSFPRDHQPHPNFAIEWWYFTANLKSNDQSYGLQYTLFRFNRGNKEANAWANGQMYMAHASLHTPEKHYFSERFAHGGQQHVGVSASPFAFGMDDWLWQAQSNHLLPASLTFNIRTDRPVTSVANIEQSQVTVDLNLTAAGPLILQGDQGFSEKSTLGTHASYYYSQPFIRVDGTITEHANKGKQTSRVSGRGWFDHEWTSQLLDQQTLGWDWFSIHLDNGQKLMAFRMRLKDSEDYITGTLIDADGTSTTLPNNSIKLTPTAFETDSINNTRYPTYWSLDIANHMIELNISPSKEKQWNSGRFQYYEGAIEVNGTHSGSGFMELTGY